METKELIPALRSDAEWAHANEWETPITLGDHLDAAADEIEALASVTAERDALKEMFSSDNKPLETAICSVIDAAPTADVAPVVHGEWVLVGTNEHDYETSVEEKCSLCGRYVYRYDTEPQDNYCPNCGAKMDKEAQDERND